MLSDKLVNVGAPVTNQCLVLQLIVGLNDSYDGLAMMLQQTIPLPEFHDVPSKLVLEETRKASQTSAIVVAVWSTLPATTSFGCKMLRFVVEDFWKIDFMKKKNISHANEWKNA
ncbi:hypothetical protein L1987_06274 [Smallanthus sonchifolius]|uniref:Uncharacterized protein n=1 Tax=Smallanthus sonchifolius TaxID=185202 RepID=A0ACB9JXP8_9ASTR|nr:hypothetical protein L1987_06274 [Smallanthus sonchifolius]